MPEEKHAQKPTWRRGYQSYAKTEYLLCTLTPSDCSTKRLRPPSELVGLDSRGLGGPDGSPGPAAWRRGVQPV